MPALRFPEFKDAGEWEEKLLQDISPAIFDGTHQTPKYTDEGIPFYSVENIVSGNKNKFISKEDHKAATRINKPEKGDILITRIGSIGFSAVVTWDFEFSIYVTLAVVKKSKEFNSQYLHGYFQSPRYQTEIQKKSLLNAVPCKINMDELRKTEVLLPEPEEQQKIADCLTSVDELITAQTQKLDTLKAHKKGLMQQLFPAEGETVPKLRFPEFRDEGEWEQRLIEDFFFVGSSKRVLQQDWTTQGVPFYRTRELVSLSKNEPFGSEIFISEELFREITEKYGLPSEGDFLVSGVGTLGISYQVQARDKFYFKDGNVLWFKLKGGIVSTFFKYCFEADEIQDQILRQASISTVGTYTIQNAKATKFSCPPNIEEQQKIADCLSYIDELITAQAQKLDALQAHKKGLMQQLFPAMNEVDA